MKQALNISNLSGGGDFLRPNVSLVTDTDIVYFNPLEKELPYLTITALEDDLTVSFTLNPCQYSLNGTDWVELQADEQTPAISSGEKIYFKAEGLTPHRLFGIGIFAISKPFNLSGTVMSMIFGDEAEGKTDLTGYDYVFSSLFSYTPVVNVSSDFLPATTLAENCYSAIFAGCTSLVQAPELPATNLMGGCYGGMFSDCTSLVNTPELLATTLAEDCYSAMFSGCTSLVNAPELPVTELASGCYSGIFYGCTSLVNAPELPATTLADSCYSAMFHRCTSLVNAPELPATTLADYCYGDMFEGCTSLNYIKMLATDISASNCLTNWVFNVAEIGTFVKSKDATWDVTGKNGIPNGWTVETA